MKDTIDSMRKERHELGHKLWCASKGMKEFDTKPRPFEDNSIEDLIAQRYTLLEALYENLTDTIKLLK